MATSSPTNHAQMVALGQVILFQAADATHHVGKVFRKGELPVQAMCMFCTLPIATSLSRMATAQGLGQPAAHRARQARMANE